MQIIPALPNYQQNYSMQKHNQATHIHKSAMSFKGLLTNFFVVGSLKVGASLLEGKKNLKYINTIKKDINSDNLNNYINGLVKLTKTPNSFYDHEHQGSILWIDPDSEYINDLRNRALYKISNISDDNHYNIQVKKEFLKSFFDNGHELCQIFLEKFKSLPDCIYKTFKEETIDTCLYSKKYNTIRKNRYLTEPPLYPREYVCRMQPFCIEEFQSNRYDYSPSRESVFLGEIYNNLKLISSLDKLRYSTFISNRRSTIDQCKQKIEDHFNKICLLTSSERERPVELFNDYNQNVKPL